MSPDATAQFFGAAAPWLMVGGVATVIVGGKLFVFGAEKWYLHGKRLAASRDSIIAFVTPKLDEYKADSSIVMTNEEIAEVKRIVENAPTPSNASTRYRARRFIGGAIMGLGVLAVVLGFIAACTSGAADSHRAHEHDTERLTRLVAPLTNRYGLPGKIDLDNWSSSYHKGEDFFSGLFGDAPATCPAGADDCYTGAVLMPDRTVKDVALVIIDEHSYLTDPAGAELPHAAGK